MLNDAVRMARYLMLACCVHSRDAVRDAAEYHGLSFNAVWSATFSGV